LAKIIISHPTGNEFFRAAAKGFYEAAMLQSVYTSIASFRHTLLYNAGGVKIFSDIRRRALDNSFKSLVHTHPWKEAGRLMAIKAGQEKWVAPGTGIFSVDAVYRSLDTYLAKNLNKEKQKGATGIYAYEDGALYSFRKAKGSGFGCFYDLPIGYWRAMHIILSAEKELNPDWAETLGGLKDSAEKLNRKDEEISLSDKIFVASSFTAETLKKYPGKLPPVSVIPYGFPVAKRKEYREFSAHQKLKILFVGGLSQRKGLSYLFKSVEGLSDHIILTIIGRAASHNCKPLTENLSRHVWIESLPHDKVLACMREQDLLVFPSLFEGFGQVITEAMAQGTPVITTERTAGPDIIKHGKNGWLVHAGSAEEIRNVLEEILLRPQLIEEVGTQALETAAQRPWEIYGRELAEAVASCL
jgi:glycosyltransferase involved in cell wall biosynthesis